jgi:hypothetical protein
MVGMSNTEVRTAKCLRCGRTRNFRTAAAAAKASPHGRICRARILAAALTEAVRDFTARQVEKARELIADGGLVPTSRPGVFRAVSSDGLRTYLTSARSCGCAHGLHTVKEARCLHSIGARILGATTKAV